MMYGDLPQMIGSIQNALGIDLELEEAIRNLWRPSVVEDYDAKFSNFPKLRDAWPEMRESMRKAETG